MPTILSTNELAEALSRRDLTDGPRAVRLITQAAGIAYPQRKHAHCTIIRWHPSKTTTRSSAPAGRGHPRRQVHPQCPAKPACCAATTAMLPPALRELARRPTPDNAVVCAGSVYRRDAVDRIHSGTPHQMDQWRLSASFPGRRTCCCG
jgi:phenylalanyl-tRNA synthetase alpha chain